MRECPRCERCYEDKVVVCPEDHTATKSTLPGSTLLSGRYRFEKRLARGAMGHVYLARDERLASRQVVVKTIRPDVFSNQNLSEDEVLLRFEREAREAASIQHPNAVAVTDFGKSDDDILFLVMEYVEGESLHQLLRREGTLSVGHALTLLRQICAGVEAAHDEGILHLDLKPSNVLLIQRKGRTGAVDDRVKVGDFGLTRLYHQSQAEISSPSELSIRGILNTPEYAAPEQMLAETALDVRADIYALGVIAYQMLGGRPPFTGDTTQVFTQKQTQEAPALSTLRSDIPGRVEQAVMHALKRQADARPDSVASWLDEFDTVLSSPEPPLESVESRLVVMGPAGADVYVDDESYGRIDRSGRIILKSILPGRHVLRVTDAVDTNERVIEIRPGAGEQIIQAQIKPVRSSELSPSQSASLGMVADSTLPAIVTCTICGTRFAAGVKFCGKCGNSNFPPVATESKGRDMVPRPLDSSASSGSGTARPNVPPQIFCSRCGTQAAAAAEFCMRCGLRLPGVAVNWTAPREATSAEERPIYLDENVQFTVYKPKKIKPAQWYDMLAYAHLSEARPGSGEPDPVEQMKDEARRILGEVKIHDYSPAGEASSQAVPQMGEITFVPFMPGVDFNPRSSSFLWEESVHGEKFRIRASAALDGKTARGRMSVFLGSILLAEINLTIQVDSVQAPAADRAEPEPGVSTRPFRNIFPSYSHDDTDIVAQIEQYAQLTGDKYLRDVNQLRSGQNWKRWMQETVFQADIFQLFWSTNSMRSENVRLEWEHALSLRRPDFIRPTYWEDPFPELAEENLPPPELKDLYFQPLRIFTKKAVSKSAEFSRAAASKGAEERASLDRGERTLEKERQEASEKRHPSSSSGQSPFDLGLRPDFPAGARLLNLRRPTIAGQSRMSPDEFFGTPSKVKSGVPPAGRSGPSALVIGLGIGLAILVIIVLVILFVLWATLT